MSAVVARVALLLGLCIYHVVALDFDAHAQEQLGDSNANAGAGNGVQSKLKSVPQKASAGWWAWRAIVIVLLVLLGYIWSRFRSAKPWAPLAADPAVMTKLLRCFLYGHDNEGAIHTEARRGFSSSAISRPGNDVAFVDVLSLEDATLVPRPCFALILLFPSSAGSEPRRKRRLDDVRRSGQQVSPRLRFIRQVRGGTCGTIAVAHAALNARGLLNNQKSHPGPLLRWARSAPVKQALDAAERSAAFVDDADIRLCHEACAGPVPGRDGTGTSTRQAADAARSSSRVATGNHFICFTAMDGALYELDGRNPFPIRVAELPALSSSAEVGADDGLVAATLQHVRKLVAASDGDRLMNWALLALCRTRA